MGQREHAVAPSPLVPLGVKVAVGKPQRKCSLAPWWQQSVVGNGPVRDSGWIFHKWLTKDTSSLVNKLVSTLFFKLIQNQHRTRTGLSPQPSSFAETSKELLGASFACSKNRTNPHNPAEYHRTLLRVESIPCYILFESSKVLFLPCTCTLFPGVKYQILDACCNPFLFQSNPICQISQNFRYQ